MAKVHFTLSQLKSTVDVNWDRKEKYEGIKVVTSPDDSKSIVATRDIIGRQIIGEFEPIAKFHLRDPQYDRYATVPLCALLLTNAVIKSENQSVLENILELYPRSDSGGEICQHIYKVVRYNWFDGSHDTKFLYYTPSFINHACNANSMVLFSETKAYLLTMCPIKKGQEITITYNTAEDATLRKEQLKQTYGFDCTCDLCENGRSFSSWVKETGIQCNQCGQKGNHRCSRCHGLYCSQECQKKHWKVHKYDCDLLRCRVRQK